MAAYIQPGFVVEPGRFHHQRVAIPLASRISKPGWLNIFLGKRAAVGIDLAMRAVRFVHYDGHTGRLNYLSPLRDETGEWDAEGQTNFPVFYSAGTPAKNFRGFGAHGSFVRLEIHQHVEGVLGYGIDL